MKLKKTMLGYTTIVFIVLLVAVMFSVLVRAFTREVLVEKLSMNNNIIQAIFNDEPHLVNDSVKKITIDDWSQLYPYKGEQVKVVKDSGVSIFESFENKIFRAEAAIEKYAKDYLFNRIKWTEYANEYEKIIGWNINGANEYNAVVKLHNGSLGEYNQLVDVEPVYNSVVEFHDYLSSIGVELLYIQSPFKICKLDSKLNGVFDFSNINADNMLQGLKKDGVDYLDLRDNIHKENLNHYDLFYLTDHHWKAETGLWATKVISEVLYSDYGFKIDRDLYEEENYNFRVYEDWFLGVKGKKITLSQTEAENFSLIFPKYNSDITFRIPSLSIDETGSFDVFYNYNEVEEKDYYNKDPYSAYIYGNNALTTVHNNYLSDGKRILVIKDSFFNTVAPFLAMGVEYLDILDLRQFNGSIKTFIEENKPDIVLIMYQPGIYNSADLEKVFGFE